MARSAKNHEAYLGKYQIIAKGIVLEGDKEKLHGIQGMKTFPLE